MLLISNKNNNSWFKPTTNNKFFFVQAVKPVQTPNEKEVRKRDKGEILILVPVCLSVSGATLPIKSKYIPVRVPDLINLEFILKPKRSVSLDSGHA